MQDNYFPLTSTLYLDKFVSLDSESLTVFNSFERLGASHRIPLSTIEWVSTAKDLGLSRWNFKGWGIGISAVAWARDMNRSPILPTGKPDLEKTVVIKVRGDILKIGCTCEDPGSFFSRLEEVVSGIRKEIGHPPESEPSTPSVSFAGSR